MLFCSVIFLFIYFTFILSKLEFGFYKSRIYGLFTPVKNTFPNKYNWINTNNERCSPERQLLLDLQKLKEQYFTNIGKIRESHVKNNQEGAQHLAVADSVTKQ